MAVAAPGMAAAYPFGREAEGLEKGIFAERLQPVLGTAGRKAAAAGQYGRYGVLIELDKKNEYFVQYAHNVQLTQFRIQNSAF